MSPLISRRLFSLSFLLFSTTAMLGYRGSSQYVTERSRFSLLHNFLSDLGASQGYNHVPTALWINVCFALALWSAAGAAFVFFRSAEREVRYPSRLRQLTVPLIVFLVAIPLTPADAFTWPHRFLVLGAALFLSICSLYVGAQLRRRDSGIVIFRAYALLATAYVMYIVIGPLPSAGLEARMIHSVAQKVVVYGFLIAVCAVRLPKERT